MKGVVGWRYSHEGSVWGSLQKAVLLQRVDHVLGAGSLATFRMTALRDQLVEPLWAV